MRLKYRNLWNGSSEMLKSREVKIQSSTSSENEFLDTLRIQKQVVIDSVQSGLMARSRENEFSPRTAPGYHAWSAIVKDLRFQLKTLNWGVPKYENGLDLIVSPLLNINIVVSSGDKDTGLKNTSPRLNNEKGEGFKSTVDLNYDLFDEFESFNSAMAYDTNQTWILLYYINEDCSEAHFEISLPISLENGQVTGWKKRFIFDPIIRSQPAFNKKDVEANFSEEIDLVITRKNG